MNNLNDLRDECLKIATEHGFTKATIGEDIALMHSELSEALEEHRKGRQPDWGWYEDKYGESGTEEEGDKPCGIPFEMADCIIRILHFCGKYNIDIQRSVSEKMEYNRTRPYKHNKVL